MYYQAAPMPQEIMAQAKNVIGEYLPFVRMGPRSREDSKRWTKAVAGKLCAQWQGERVDEDL